MQNNEYCCLKRKICEQESANASLNGQIESLKNQLAAAQAKIKSLTDQNFLLSSQNQALNLENSAIRAQNQDLLDQNAKMEEVLTANGLYVTNNQQLENALSNPNPSTILLAKDATFNIPAQEVYSPIDIIGNGATINVDGVVSSQASLAFNDSTYLSDLTINSTANDVAPVKFANISDPTIPIANVTLDNVTINGVERDAEFNNVAYTEINNSTFGSTATVPIEIQGKDNDITFPDFYINDSTVGTGTAWDTSILVGKNSTAYIHNTSLADPANVDPDYADSAQIIYD
ncbi:MAG: hypothetical protein LBN25_00555 [Christensenellaceae bacterium]|jgi:hypothetical protein|nr:hypothetical protein [Christensenellaceae bacterium]